MEKKLQSALLSILELPDLVLQSAMKRNIVQVCNIKKDLLKNHRQNC